jgi:Spy/CpxP family protein refolding chaperone
MAQNLNLSADQQKQIRASVHEFRDRLIEQRATVQKAEGNLQDLMNEDQVNDARAREAIDKLVAARSELMRTISQMTLKMRLVLTPEQWQQVQKRRAGQALQPRQQRQQFNQGLRPGQRF